MKNENNEEFDYLENIRQRLSKKADILNISGIQRHTKVPRRVIATFMQGEIPNTSFSNIMALYTYLEEQNI